MVQIIYDNNEDSVNLVIKGYSNSNQTSDQTTRKSISDFIFKLNDGLVSWYSKRQAIITFLLIEIEYIVLILTPKEITQLRLLLTKIDLLNKDI